MKISELSKDYTKEMQEAARTVDARADDPQADLWAEIEDHINRDAERVKVAIAARPLRK